VSFDSSFREEPQSLPCVRTFPDSEDLYFQCVPPACARRIEG
jgi:hypothetical protein